MKKKVRKKRSYELEYEYYNREDRVFFAVCFQILLNFNAETSECVWPL